MNAEKLAAQKQWNQTPCGTGDFLAGIQYGSLAFFDEVRRSRYEDTDPWMPRTIDFGFARGKKLLEIGHGIGSDLLTFREAGAEVYGIDITEEHHRLAKLNFELHGQKGEFRLCDAAAIDFPAESFDMVYSLGVLHHTPDTVRCISEAYRVLKPGGRLVLGLYHRHSAFHYVAMLLYRGLFLGQLRRLGYDGLMATLEHGADGIETKPLVKTYARRQLRHILGDFAAVEITAAHLRRDHFPGLGRLLPRALEPWLDRALGSWFGWYLVATATK